MSGKRLREEIERNRRRRAIKQRRLSRLLGPIPAHAISPKGSWFGRPNALPKDAPERDTLRAILRAWLEQSGACRALHQHGVDTMEEQIESLMKLNESGAIRIEVTPGPGDEPEAYEIAVVPQKVPIDRLSELVGISPETANEIEELFTALRK